MAWELVKKRGKGKYTADWGISDMFRYFRRNTKDEDFLLERRDFCKVISLLNMKAMDRVIERAETLKFPSRMGEIRIIGKELDISKEKSLSIDWKKSNELKKKVYLLNDDTDNIRYRFVWNARGNFSNCPNKTRYFYKPSRIQSRRIKDCLRSDDKSINYPIRY